MTALSHWCSPARLSANGVTEHLWASNAAGQFRAFVDSSEADAHTVGRWGPGGALGLVPGV